MALPLFRMDIVEALLRSHAELRAALRLAWNEIDALADGEERAASVLRTIQKTLADSLPIADRAEAHVLELSALLALLSEDCDQASPIFDVPVNRWVH